MRAVGRGILVGTACVLLVCLSWILSIAAVPTRTHAGGTKRRWVAPSRMGGCYALVTLLLLQGRLRGIVWQRPFHYLGVLHGGDYVHFTTDRKAEQFAPWWYSGRVQIRQQPTARHTVAEWHFW